METITQSYHHYTALDLDLAYSRCQYTLNDIAFNIARLKLLIAQYKRTVRRRA